MQTRCFSARRGEGRCDVRRVLAHACRVCILNFALCIATVHAQSLVSVGARQLVMPFENETHDPRYDWLGEGAASVLTEDLPDPRAQGPAAGEQDTALGAQALSREDRLRAFDHLRVPATNKLSEATIIRVAQIVGAEQVITGSTAGNGSSLALHARAAP